MKYDLKGYIRSNKAYYVYLFSSNNSSVKPTLPHIICSLDVETQIKIMYDIKASFNEAFLYYGEVGQF